MLKFILILLIVLVSCNNQEVIQENSMLPEQEEKEVLCTDESCEGTYVGPEFINGDDIAHQFSNTMSHYVGDKLKALYQEGKYAKVDFSSIIMTTEGMGTGNVTYYLKIPFVQVAEKCDAYTSFDHVGGWNHKPALERRKKELEKVLLKGEILNISSLKKTPEGLQEYWIQWKNNEVQAECELQNNSLNDYREESLSLP